MRNLQILISNDDGIYSKGVRSLALAAAKRGHSVTVVCPDQERSATGHGLTLHSPIRATQIEDLFVKGVSAWGCSGTPADCVKLALFELLDRKPDLVLSGINHGPNLGTDIFCSGTVAAAMEGTLEGLPSLATSIASYQWSHFDEAAELTLDIAEKALKSQWKSNLLLNLNIPPCETKTMKDLRWTRLSIRTYQDQFTRRVDPHGNKYFWLAGEAINDLEAAGAGPAEWPTDVAQIDSKGPSITPIQPDLFWRGPLNQLPELDL